jgi:hypothetical protein
MALLSDFVADFVRLLAEPELDFSSSSRDLVPVEGFTGLAASSLHLLSLGLLPCLASLGWFWNIGNSGKKNASAGLGFAAAIASAANTAAALGVGRTRMGTPPMDPHRRCVNIARAAARAL